MSTVNSSTPLSPITRTVGTSGASMSTAATTPERPSGSVDLMADRIRHDDGAEVAHDRRAELGARTGADDAHADVRRRGRLVDALGGDGVVDVGDGGDPRELLDLGAVQPLGVAGAVDALVVVADHRDRRAVRGRRGAAARRRRWRASA